MKILLTGGSSFTGAWFAHSLLRAGHIVVATLRGSAGSYGGIRRQRVEWLMDAGVTFIEQCAFGDERFLRAMEDGADVLCHHGANVENYKSPDFDIIAALAENSRRLRDVLRAGKAHGLKSVVLTGSVFEADEGAGNLPLRAFSPYGVSKGLTAQVFGYWCEDFGMPLRKFVIPNPFGPYEEPRLCAYLLQRWVKGETPQINTPDYVRDNIHVDLLARAYVAFVADGAARGSRVRLNPSGYAETQGAFVTRFAREIGSRLGIATPVAFARQTEFAEPFARINVDRIVTDWSEDAAWDRLADYYRQTYLSAST